MPDLQGPFDTAEQLWGADIYLSFYDRPERADLISGATQQDFPTGVLLVYLAEDLEDAREVIRCYQQQPTG